MTLKQDLMERSGEIKYLVEKELRALDKPISIADLIRRTGASRLPVERHLKTLLMLPEFDQLSVVRIGSYDVIYKIWKVDSPKEATGKSEPQPPRTTEE